MNPFSGSSQAEKESTRLNHHSGKVSYEFLFRSLCLRVKNILNEIEIMKFTWMLLMAIVMASSVRSNYPAVIPESMKKDHLVVMASEVSYNFLLVAHIEINICL